MFQRSHFENVIRPPFATALFDDFRALRDLVHAAVDPNTSSTLQDGKS